ncbi:phage upper tail fiber protein [Nocardia concava]|uniref:phage upper tail fiber protein n=1 Tax=Nocardia concava TaxID=257281 RepID=UPI0002FF2954|nr:hypothetical protein [Nocardia concava]
MTVISEPIANIAGADNSTTFEFASLVLRQSASGTGTITTAPFFVQAVAGVLTTPSLDPGPALVRIGNRQYQITVPSSATPVRLWPLIQAGLPVPPTEDATAVRNGGGIARAQRITASAYAALTTPDPETLYLVVEG